MKATMSAWPRGVMVMNPFRHEGEETRVVGGHVLEPSLRIGDRESGPPDEIPDGRGAVTPEITPGQFGERFVA